MSGDQHVPGLLAFTGISDVSGVTRPVIVLSLHRKTTYCGFDSGSVHPGLTTWNVIWNMPFKVSSARGLTGLWRPGITPEEQAAICAMASKHQYSE
jgi:hypothetical protein